MTLAMGVADSAARAAREIEAIYPRRTPRSRALHERAQGSLPGGSTRAGTFYRPYPAYMTCGSGCRLTDVDDNGYIDCLNNYTSLIRGHAHPRLVTTLAEQAGRGTAHGVTGIGSLGHIHAGRSADASITNYRAALEDSRTLAALLHLAFLTRGVFLAPRGMWSVSTAMSDAGVDAVLDAFEHVVTTLAPAVRAAAL